MRDQQVEVVTPAQSLDVGQRLGEVEAGVEEDHLDPRVDTDSDVDEHGILKRGGDGDLTRELLHRPGDDLGRVGLVETLRGFVDLRQKARGRSAVMPVGFEAASLIHQRKFLMCGLQCIASPGATGVCATISDYSDHIFRESTGRALRQGPEGAPAVTARRV